MGITVSPLFIAQVLSVVSQEARLSVRRTARKRAANFLHTGRIRQTLSCDVVLVITSYHTPNWRREPAQIIFPVVPYFPKTGIRYKKHSGSYFREIFSRLKSNCRRTHEGNAFPLAMQPSATVYSLLKGLSMADFLFSLCDGDRFRLLVFQLSRYPVLSGIIQRFSRLVLPEAQGNLPSFPPHGTGGGLSLHCRFFLHILPPRRYKGAGFPPKAKWNKR